MMHAQFFLLAHCVSNHKSISQSVVINKWPPLLNRWPHPHANVLLHCFKQTGRNCGQRNLIARYWVIGLVSKTTCGLCSSNHCCAKFRSPERHANNVWCNKRGVSGVYCTFVSEYGFKISHCSMVTPTAHVKRHPMRIHAPRAHPDPDLPTTHRALQRHSRPWPPIEAT